MTITLTLYNNTTVYIIATVLGLTLTLWCYYFGLGLWLGMLGLTMWCYYILVLQADSSLAIPQSDRVREPHVKSAINMGLAKIPNGKHGQPV